MKKSIALLLVCLLILPLPVLADAPSASLAGLFSALTQPTDGTVRYVSAPKWIFPDDDYNLIAADPDGGFWLVTSPRSDLILWNQQTRASIPLTFVRAEEAEEMAMRFEMGILMQLKKEQRVKMQEQLTANREAYLSRHGLAGFQALDQIIACYGDVLRSGRFKCYALNQRYAFVLNPAVAGVIVDLQTGALRMIPAGPDRTSLCGDRFLYSDIQGNGVLLDLTNGEETSVSLLAGTWGQVKAVSGVRLFPDGSIHILGRSDIALDEAQKKMTETDYYVLNAASITAVCLKLGQTENMQTPTDLLVTEDGAYALAYSPQYYWFNGSSLIDLKTGGVTQADASLLPVAVRDGAFLCYDLEASGVGNNYLISLNPQDLSRTALRGSDSGWQPFSASSFERSLWGVSTFAAPLARCGQAMYPQNMSMRGYLVVD